MGRGSLGREKEAAMANGGGGQGKGGKDEGIIRLAVSRVVTRLRYIVSINGMHAPT